MRSRPAPARDVRLGDVALGVLVAATVLGGSARAVASAMTNAVEDPAPLLAAGEIAVAVRPVELHEDPPPDAPFVPATTGIGVPRSTKVAPRPADAPAPVPADARPERPIGGIRALPRLSAPKTERASAGDAPAAPGFGPGGPAIAPGTADPADSPDDPYAYVDQAQEDPNAAPGTGLVADDDPDQPSGDPLAARAVAAYRQRLQRWLSAHFTVTGSGLASRELRRAKIHARIEIADDRTLAGWTIAPGGHPVVEAAAVRALEAVAGQPVPEPPEHYPGPLQRFVAVTFVCTEATCD